jgi:imidazolonepropionase-like amidohydrolase
LVLDVTGKHVTPGLIDPHSHLGVYALPSLKGHSDGNEVGNPLTPAVRVADAIYSQDPAMSRALAGGVTTAQIVPGSANLAGGLSQVIKLRPGRHAMDLAFPGALPGLKMACGENPKRVYGPRGGPFTRMGNVARVRAAFGRASDYLREWGRYAELYRAWAGKSRRASSSSAKPPPAPPKRDPDLESLAAVVAGRVRIHWHCYRADEMLVRLELAGQLGLKIAAFHHATEAYKIADELRRAGVGAVTWVRWWGFKAEALDAIPEGPALLAKRGALVTLHSDSPRVIQHLNHEAGLAYYRGVQAGIEITPGQALAMVTRNPAEALGISKETGTLEPGKMADLVVWSGDPFSIYTRAEKVYVDGELAYDLREGPRPSDFELGQVPSRRPPRPADAREAMAGPDVPVPGLPGKRVAPPRPPARHAVLPKPKGPVTLAVTGARLQTMTGEPPTLGTLLVAGDRIAALGPGLAAPRGVKVIDAGGALVTPGLIAAESLLGLTDIDAEPSANETGASKSPELLRAALRSWEGLHLRGAAIPVNQGRGFHHGPHQAEGGARDWPGGCLRSLGV